VSGARAAPLAPWALGAALLAAGSAHGETLYVIEQLVVNLNSAADASGERVASLKSGDKVELIERAGDAVHVRLPNGRDGWLRATYLSADEPLGVRLAEREHELAQVKEDLAQARAQLSSAPPAGTAAALPRAATAGEEAAPLFAPAAQHSRPAWPWALGCAILGLAAGFALGVLLLDRHIRRKFGGLRIY
jgi:hypothetical protein